MANNNKIVPINRINRFFSDEDYRLEIEMGREAIESDGNFKVILYRVNRALTISDTYGESRKGEIAYAAPVELSVMPTLAKAENMAFNKSAGSMRDLQDGNLEFVVYQAHLDELDVDISFGDYIGYQVTETEVRFFSVTNDGVKNYDNAHTIMGYKGAYRLINCAPIDENEFKSE
jgi:hypothetical protein